MSARRRPRARPRQSPAAARAAATPGGLEGLPDKLVMRVLQELSQPDLLQVARVSSRLHALCLDGALWRDLGVLGPDVATERACALLRHGLHLTALRLHGRADADVMLLEASRCCPALQELEVTRCRGSAGYRGLSYVPLVRLAQGCRRLRRVLFRETDFVCSRVFKAWADLRGPEAPVLEIGVNSLTRRQAAYLTSVLNGPAELHVHAAQGTPFVLHVHEHELRLQPAEEAAGVVPCASWQSPRDSAVAASSARVRPPPSATASSEELSPEHKRPRLEDGSRARGAGATGSDLVLVFSREPTPSTSTGAQGGQERRDHVPVDALSDTDTDDIDVVVAPPPPAPAEAIDDDMSPPPGPSRPDDPAPAPAPAPAPTPAPRRIEYKSVFGMGPTSEPLLNSWFRSGYMPDCEPEPRTDSEDGQPRRPPEQGARPAAPPDPADPSAARTAMLPLPGTDSDDDAEAVAVEVTAVVEEAHVGLGMQLPPLPPLPAAATRLADSLKEPEDRPRPAGDPQQLTAQRPSTPRPPRGHHGPVDGDHVPDDASPEQQQTKGPAPDTRQQERQRLFSDV